MYLSHSLSFHFPSLFWLSLKSDTSPICSSRTEGEKKGGEAEELGVTLHTCSSSSSLSAPILCPIPPCLSSPQSPLLSLLFSSFHLQIQAEWCAASRCVVCLIVRKCVFECCAKCASKSHTREPFFPPTKSYCACVVAGMSVC